MKLLGRTLALALAATSGVSAFAPLSTPSSSLSSTSLASTAVPETAFDDSLFPTDIPLELIQGGKTVKTFPLAPGTERIQLLFKTNGRPLKGKVNLWLGPLRQTHTLEMDVEDGNETPIRYTLKFKPVGQVLRIETSSMSELPMLAGVLIPTPERQKELQKNTEAVWAAAEKTIIQGGSTEGGGGAIRTWAIPENVESVQFLSWARDTGMKSFKMDLELLHGPNNVKQKFLLQCGGGSQPWHGIFETPGPDWQIRLRNKKFLEDGLFQCAVVPFKVRE
mmetsp:Transcript_104998/g.303818  ORF Transcript_104998/g.303818 Transcript_104998/m.303818 type:complete len:278 (-) Transcript_104998:163-996(-)|eukprot:CAMPEP_0176002834 /NCGR_PEP_ID=MMETSP0120_2-20121206/855_1 /TAXON_ID=160619 /ORGANISM="Kryptoperidinium foliaceum, Strain CCMP 1326" /LENGTH=277 /DNA_ID=CAMNT_0017335443 /DNA_START=111 /DNA_END=944 /DNA_ORIENTATION=+